MRVFKVLFMMGLLTLASIGFTAQPASADEGEGTRCVGSDARCVGPHLQPIEPAFKSTVSGSAVVFRWTSTFDLVTESMTLKITRKGGKSFKFDVPLSACDPMECTFTPQMKFKSGARYTWKVMAQLPTGKIKGEKGKFTFGSGS